jgi:Leucine-rich repeat (LRR) protein
MKEQDEFYFKEVHFNTELLNLDLPSLEKIYIIRCKLTRIDKTFFSDLPNLEELYLSQNSFVELDKDLFKNLTSLKELKVNNNKIPK